MKLLCAFRAPILAIAVSLAVVLIGGCAGQPAAPTLAPAPTTVPTSLPPTATVPPATATPRPPTATSQPPTSTSMPAATSTPTMPTSKPAEVVEASEPTPRNASMASEASQGNQPDVPAPPEAAGLAYDASAREFSFTSPSEIASLADFYRRALPGKGWTEDSAGAVLTDNFGSLDFNKGDASLNITLVDPGGGAETSVTVDVSGIPEKAREAAEATPGAVSTGAGLKAVDKDGLPLPEDYTSYEGENSAFRTGAKVSSPSSLKAVLELLRGELAARKWAELPATVAATDDKATLLFANPDQGKLELKLTKIDGGGTDVVLTVRSEASAKAAGALPPAGKARIYFGNITGGQVVFTIDKQEIKVAVDAPGKTSMEGVPFVDLAPGSYSFTLTLAGQRPTSDKVEVGADETWALVGGPGGALALQMY